MGIEVRWDDEKTGVIRWDMTNPIIGDDFFTAQDQTFELSGDPTNQVDILVALAPDLRLPSGALSTMSAADSRVRRLAAGAESGIVVIVGGSVQSNALLNLFLKINPQSEWKTTTTTEQAYAMIDERRALST